MGNVCVKNCRRVQTNEKRERRSVRIVEVNDGLARGRASGEAISLKKRAAEQATRHSQSTPFIRTNNGGESVSPSCTSARKKIGHSTTTYSIGADKEVAEEEFQHMLRQFTRKTLSAEHLTDAHLQVPKRGPRRDSRIDDREVLKLIAAKSQDPHEKQEFLNLERKASGAMSLEEARTVAPHLVERVQRRRQTMEKLDIFSPDAAPDRLEELYDATEKLLAHEDQVRLQQVHDAGQARTPSEHTSPSHQAVYQQYQDIDRKESNQTS